MVTAMIGLVPSVIFHLLMAYSNAQMRPTNWDRGRFPSGDDLFNQNSNGNNNFFRNGIQPGQMFPNTSPRSGNDEGGQISPPPNVAPESGAGFGFQQSENTPSRPSVNNMGPGTVETSNARPQVSRPREIGGFGRQDQSFKPPTPGATSRTPFKAPDPDTVSIIRPTEQEPTRSGYDANREQEPLGKGGQGVVQDLPQDAFRNNDPVVNQDERRRRQGPQVPDRLSSSQDKIRGPRRSAGGSS